MCNRTRQMMQAQPPKTVIPLMETKIEQCIDIDMNTREPCLNCGMCLKPIINGIICLPHSWLVAFPQVRPL